MLQNLHAASTVALTRIRSLVRVTPLEPSPWLSNVGSCTAYLKLESEQHSGSFKARGAVNKVLSLGAQQLQSGIVTCSTGNHALAVTYACQACPQAWEVPTAVYLAHSASPSKVARLRLQGAHLIFHGQDCVEAELEARRRAEEQGATYISPYNDWEVMAGQGTIALELLQQLEEQQPGAHPDVVLVPVGGGGLIGGIAAVLKTAWPSCTVVGCQPAASAVMAASVAAGRILDLPSEQTLSDATAGGIEPDAVTLKPCQLAVDRWELVSEQEIADAVISLLQHHSKLVEGAAGCALAAFRRLVDTGQLKGKHVVVVCCGGNIGPATLQEILGMGKVWGMTATAASQQ